MPTRPNRAKRPNHVWVVEMWISWAQRWEPTMSCGLTRAGAKRERDDFAERCGDGRFRVRRYDAAK